jgi:MFS transporter, DHA1 family, tetracycline resistance protein
VASDPVLENQPLPSAVPLVAPAPAELGGGRPLSRAAFAFVFVTVCLDMLALGLVVPVLPKLVVQFEHGNFAEAATVTGIFGFAWASMQFAFSPVLGALSDRFGRRPVILISNFGLGLDYVLMALAPSLGWLFCGRVISGITAASFSTATAYIADVSPPEKRAGQFGMLGAAFGIGFVLGPALGGLLGGIGLRLPFWAAAGLSLANAAYGLFILPESLPRERRVKVGFRTANPLGGLSLLRSHTALWGLTAATALYYLAHESLPSVFVLYTTRRYGWGARETGLALAAVGLTTALVSAAVVGPAVRRLGERRSLLLGLFFGAVGMALYGLAPDSLWFAVGIPIFALMGIVGPSLQALVTRKVGGSEQGRLQGALSSLRGVMGMVGPLLFTQTFALGLKGAHLPGLPYLLAALLLLASCAVAAATTRAKLEDRPSGESPAELQLGD